MSPAPTLALLALGCRSEAPMLAEPPVIPDVPTVDELVTDDTGEGGLVAGERKYVRELRINGFVAWDATARTVTDIRLGGQGYISAFEMQLSVPGGTSSADELDRCSVLVRLTSMTASEPVEPTERFRLEVPAGLEDDGLPGGVKEVFSECEERMFTGEQYPEGYTMENWWASLPWTMLLLEGALDPDLESELVEDGVDPALYAQGEHEGRFESPRYGHLTFWRAYELGPGAVLAGTADEITARRLPRDEMLAGEPGNPPTAYYIFDQLIQWELPDLLDLEP